MNTILIIIDGTIMNRSLLFPRYKKAKLTIGMEISYTSDEVEDKSRRCKRS